MLRHPPYFILKLYPAINLNARSANNVKPVTIDGLFILKTRTEGQKTDF